MRREEIRQAVTDFLRVVEDREETANREEALRAVLDRLAMAYHFADAPCDPREYPEPPEEHYGALRTRIEPLFPRLGLYIEASGTADAIDDLTDITIDLKSVLFRWENTSEADALWHFRFGFESHWGGHLRSLQLYLHELAC